MCINVDDPIMLGWEIHPNRLSQVDWANLDSLLLQIPSDRWGEGSAGLRASCVHNYDNSSAGGSP